jgi:hypothetical protein
MLWSLRTLPGPKRLPWEISVSVLVTLVVFPQTNGYTLVLVLVAIWVALWASEGAVIDWILFSAVLLSPWVFYILRESLPPAMEQLLIPLVTGILLTYRWSHWIDKERKPGMQLST